MSFNIKQHYFEEKKINQPLPKYLKCWMGIFFKEASILFLPPFSVGIYSQRKEFAPLGANSFLSE